MIHASYMYNVIQYYGSHFNGMRLTIKHSCKGVDTHKKLGNLVWVLHKTYYTLYSLIIEIQNHIHVPGGGIRSLFLLAHQPTGWMFLDLKSNQKSAVGSFSFPSYRRRTWYCLISATVATQKAMSVSSMTSVLQLTTSTFIPTCTPFRQGSSVTCGQQQITFQFTWSVY